MLALLALSLAVAADSVLPEESMRVDPPAKRPLVDVKRVTCRHGIGAAMGTYYGNVDWDEIGSRWGTTGSPTYDAVCAEATDDARHAWAGVLTAPFYVQFRALDGEPRQQWFSSLLGVTWGDRWQAGPVVAAGFPGVGAGGVVRLSEARAMIDFRALMYTRQYGLQAQIVYGFVPRGSK